MGENPYPYPYGSAWVDPGWLVSDNRDDESNIVVLTMGTPDTDSIGTFIIEYQALDSAGNKSTQTREVQIVDTIAPSITASETIITISQGQGFSLPEYSAADNVDGDVSDSHVISEWNKSTRTSLEIMRLSFPFLIAPAIHPNSL